MSIWADKVVVELMAVCQTDAAYQEILCQCKEAEKDYLRIIERLSFAEREKLDNYISLCEELQFQMARLAYYHGRQDPRK